MVERGRVKAKFLTHHTVKTGQDTNITTTK
jgi:hypothetical protein